MRHHACKIVDAVAAVLSIAQFKAKIKTVMVYNFYVQNTKICNIENNIKIIISEFGTFRVGLLLGPARSLFGPSEAAAHWTRSAMGQAGQRA
jgi:hypothetical protein